MCQLVVAKGLLFSFSFLCLEEVDAIRLLEVKTAQDICPCTEQLKSALLTVIRFP